MRSNKTFAGSHRGVIFGGAGNGQMLGRIRRAFVLTFVWSVSIVSPVGADIADNDPAEVVSYRQLLMRSLDLHMDGIAALIDGRIDYWGHVNAHAEAIQHMSRDMIDIFPHWTGPKAARTLALPAIWENWQEFKIAADALERAATTLVGTVGSIDRRAIRSQYARVRQTCDSCHSRFAKPD